MTVLKQVPEMYSIKQESSSLLMEGGKRKYEFPIISARQNSLLVASRNDQSTLEFCIMLIPLLQLLLFASIMLLLSTALFFVEATEMEITERKILLTMHLIDAVDEREQREKPEPDQNQGEQNFELNARSTEDNVVTFSANLSLLLTNETAASKDSLLRINNETLINKLFNYLEVYNNDNEQIAKMEKKRPKRIEKEEWVNGSEENQTIIKNDQLNKKSGTNENREYCQMLLLNNNHSSTEILVCGNESEYCFHMDSKCNGVSDCPNGYDESVQLCGLYSIYF